MINNNNYKYEYKVIYNNINDEDLSDTQYRRDILNVFNVNFNENINYNKYDSLGKYEKNDKQDDINDELNLYKIDLFDIITERAIYLFTTLPKDVDELNQICILSANRLFSNDLETGFIMLFSYETFYIIHLLLNDYNNNNQINMKYINMIKNVLI